MCVCVYICMLTRICVCRIDARQDCPLTTSSDEEKKDGIDQKKKKKKKYQGSEIVWFPPGRYPTKRTVEHAAFTFCQKCRVRSGRTPSSTCA